MGVAKNLNPIVGTGPLDTARSPAPNSPTQVCRYDQSGRESAIRQPLADRSRLIPSIAAVMRGQLLPDRLGPRNPKSPAIVVCAVVETSSDIDFRANSGGCSADAG